MLEPLAAPSSGPDASLLAEAGDHAQPSQPLHPQHPMVEEQPTPALGGQGLPAAAAAAAAPPHPGSDPQQQQLAQRAAAGAAALTDILARVSALDTEGWFRAPVREVDAPNYYKIIRRPMCFQVMQAKVTSRQYASWSEVVRDFELICSNAMKYNQKRSRIHKLALVMLRAGKKLLVEVEPEGRRAVAEMQLAPAAREGEEEGGAAGAELLLEGRMAPTSMLKSGKGITSTGLTPPSGRIVRSLSTLDTASTGEGHVGAVALDPPGAGGAHGLAEEGYSSYSETDLEGEGEPAFGGLDQGARGAAESLPHAGEAVLIQPEPGGSAAAGGATGAAGGEAAAAAEAGTAAAGDAGPGEQLKAWREARRGVEWRVRWLELRLRELRRQRRRYAEQQAQQGAARGQEALLRQPQPCQPLPEWQLPGLLKHPFFQEHSVVGQRSGPAQQAQQLQAEPMELEQPQQQQEAATALPSTPLPPLAPGTGESLPFSASTPQLLIPPTPPLPATQPAASAAAQPGPTSLGGGFGAASGALCPPALEDPHYPARAHAALSMLSARLGAVRQEILSLQQANLSLLRVGGAGAARGGGGAGGARGGHPLLMLPRGGLGSAHRAAGAGGGRRRAGGSGGLATPRRSGLSVHTGGEDGRLGKRRRNDFFDLGDVATPTLGAPKYVERVQVKTIDTPKVRQLDPEEVKRREEALAAYATSLLEGKSEVEAAEPLLEACAKEGEAGESSEEEDTSDEAYAARHKVLEEAERARYNEVFAATGQARNKKPTKVTKERKAKPSRGPIHSSSAFLTPTAVLPLGAAGAGMATPVGATALLPQSEAASAPWGPQHPAAAAATPSALHLASASLAAHVLQQAGAGKGGACVGHLPLLVMPVHPAVSAAAHMQAAASAAAVQQQQAGEAAQAATAEGEKEPPPSAAAAAAGAAGAAAAQQELGSAAAKAQQGAGADESGADESPAATEGTEQLPGTASAAAGASNTVAAAPAAGSAPPATLPVALLHAHLPSTLQAILPQGPPIAQLPAEAKRARGRPRLRPRK